MEPIVHTSPQSHRSTLFKGSAVKGEGREITVKGDATEKRFEHCSFHGPDETRTFPKGKMEILKMDSGSVGRATLEPGWRWSEHVKPIAGTQYCEAPHFQYHLSGRLRIRMANGTEFEAGPGDVTFLPAGHDAWVVGDEPVVLIDWQGASNYAKR